MHSLETRKKISDTKKNASSLRPDFVDSDFIEKRIERCTESGCWIWIRKANTGKNQYGTFTYKRKLILAHRAAWIIYRGEIPNGLFVLHSCDVSYCCNPNHLFLGTHQENMLDMHKKGRRKSKITREIAKAIRNSPLKTKDIAKQFGVGNSTVLRIKNKKSWKDIE